MKAASPSAGTLSSDYSPAALARRYTEGGAAALSVLAQSTSFGGDPEHIREARTATDLPVMRKDFITDEYQVLEARAFGADAVLLIAAALTDGQMRDLEAQIRALGMEALVEVHNRPELERVLDLGTGLIGINHRDLTTLEMDLELTERLRPLIPADRIVVAESGIRTPADAWRLRELGVDAVLVGEALMRSGDPAGLIRELGR
jgi:indole-3-glycerol phosphate synthase